MTRSTSKTPQQSSNYPTFNQAQRLDLLLPIPSRPRFERLDLGLCAGEAPFCVPASGPVLRAPGPSPLPPSPPRGMSGSALSLWRAWSVVAAAERAAARDEGSIPLASLSRRADPRCDLLARSWTDLNLSISSTQRIVFSSRVFSLPPAGRSYADEDDKMELETELRRINP